MPSIAAANLVLTEIQFQPWNHCSVLSLSSPCLLLQTQLNSAVILIVSPQVRDGKNRTGVRETRGEGVGGYLLWVLSYIIPGEVCGGGERKEEKNVLISFYRKL